MSNSNQSFSTLILANPHVTLHWPERHRECNKLVARKTRVKKKLELEALQHSFSALKTSNRDLRSILKTVAGREISSRILMDCNFQLPDNVVALVSEMLADKECMEYISTGKVDTPLRSFCITNPTVFDNPIVYASPDFTELTGYDTESIVGYNCRFLQGVGSDPAEIYRLKMAIGMLCWHNSEIHPTNPPYSPTPSQYTIPTYI